MEHLVIELNLQLFGTDQRILLIGKDIDKSSLSKSPHIDILSYNDFEQQLSDDYLNEYELLIIIQDEN